MSDAESSRAVGSQGREEAELVARTNPEWERVKLLVLDALSSPHSRRLYGKALDDFRLWAAPPALEGFTKATVQRYRAWLDTLALAPSTVNVRLTAVRKLAQEAADNGLLDPELASAIGRVKGAPQKGELRKKAGGSATGSPANRPPIF